MTTVLTSKFDFSTVLLAGDRQLPVALPSARSPMLLVGLVRELWRSRDCEVAFFSNPKLPELVLAWLVKRLFGARTCFFDLILRAPASPLQRIAARCKSRLLAGVDCFVFIHRNTSGYHEHYGIPADRCRYVPFKANNLDLVDSVKVADRGYALSLGASHRDYSTLVDAVTGLDIPVKIILPHSSIAAHNAVIDPLRLPPNVTHIGDPVDRPAWSRFIAESRLVVIPLLPGVIQPAGISVYLEAMALGKPVLITRGSSTEDILTDELAEVIEPSDPQAMRAALLRLWADGSRREALASAGRAYALGLQGHERLVRDLWGVVSSLAKR